MSNNQDRRTGFTLVEMMIALFVGALLIMISYNVLTSQKRAADAQNKYVNTQQNARVAIETIQGELRKAGLNIDDFNGQPVFVDAAPYQVIFNADISSGVSGVMGMTTDQTVPLHDGTLYSPGTFTGIGEKIGSLGRYNNNAETIRFTLDQNDNGIVDDADKYTQTQNPNDFALYREENGTRTDVVAYGIRGGDNYPDGRFPQPLFKYYGDFDGDGTVDLWGDTNGNGVMDQSEIATLSAVPVANLNNILEVEITVEAESPMLEAGYSGPHSTPGYPRRYRSVVTTSKIRPRNVATGSADLHACGDPPASPGGLSAVDTPNDAGESITLNFSASSDENSGEEDITRYAVYRRLEDESSWQCIGSIPIQGTSSYTYYDDNHTADPMGGPRLGNRYYYTVTAWDCRPQESSPSNAAGPVEPLANGPNPPHVINAYDTPCDSEDEITVVINRSPDDQASGGLVGYYEVYRGQEQDGGILSKVRVGRITADGSEYYNFLDNQTFNIAGMPPEPDNYYYYIARAVGSSADSIPSVPSNEYGAVYYSGLISACQILAVDDYPDDDGEALVVRWRKSPSEDCVPSEVTHYIVKRKAIFEPEWQAVATVAAVHLPEYSHIDEDLTRGAEYTYCVWTSDGSDPVPSNEMSAIPLMNTELEPPRNLVAEDILCDATGAINVTWDHSPQDIPAAGVVTRYNIYRSVVSGGPKLIAEVPAAGSESYLFVDGPESNPSDPPVIGQYYTYFATAYDEDEARESTGSNQDQTMSDGEPGAPWITSAYDTPADEGSSITVEFDRSADDGHCTDNVIVYNVYREETETGDFTHLVGEVTAVGATHYTFYDEDIYSYDPPVDGIGYYYSIRAEEQDGGMSVNSNIVGPVYSISQDPSTYIVFEDDFETDKGWTHGYNRTQDDWQRGAPRGNGGADYGYPDPGSAYSGTNVYGNDLGASGWNGDYKNNVDNYLITPEGAVDCGGHTNVVVQFQRWLNVEQPAYDQASIYISTSGHSGPWTEVWRNETEITDKEWVFMEIDISQWADGEQDVAIAFTLVTDGGAVYSGWNIDDFIVKENPNYP